MRLGSRIFSSVNTKSLVFGFIIIFVCFAFILTGFGSLKLGGLSSLGPSTAATVGSISIDMNEFVNFMNEQGLGNIPEAQKKYVALNVINQLVSQKILANESLNMDWQVSDTEIASAIRTVPLFQDQTTRQFSLTLFKNYIANQQTTEIDFYNYLRTQLEIQKMQHLLYLPVVVPNGVAQWQFTLNNTKFNLQYAIISIPESTLFKRVEDKAKSFASDKANLTQLKNLYDSQKEQFNQKEKIQVRSILISYKGANRAQDDALKRTKEEALSLIQGKVRQLQSGVSFEKLASEVNDDIRAKQNKGDLGFVDDTTIDPVSLKSISKLTKQNPLSDIVDTPFGYRIFQFENFKPAVFKSFDDVKIDLAKQIIGNQMRAEEENTFQVKLAQALVGKNITQINSLLSDNGITWQYLAKPFQITTDNISELGNTTNLNQEIFALKKSGDILPKIIDFGGKKAVIKLISIVESKTPSQVDLDETKKQMAAEQSQLFAQSTQKYLEKQYQKEGKIKINPIITQ